MCKFLFLLLVSGVSFAQATTYTTNYNFAKPGDGASNYGSMIRSNWDKVDTQLKIQENALSLWKKYTVSHTALATAATTNTITIVNLDAGTVIEAIVVQPTASFTGGSISAYTVDVLAGSLTLDSAIDLFAAPTDSSVGSAEYAVASFSGQYAVQLSATATGDNLDSATAGSVDVYIKYTALP